MHTEIEQQHSIIRKARYGLVLFTVYVILYGGFIFLAVFRPSLMAAPVWGLNVAIAYGFALILAALILALVYTTLCGRAEADRQAAE